MKLEERVRLKLHAAAAADESMREILARELAAVMWWNAQVRARADLDAWHQARRAAPPEVKEADPRPPRKLDGAH